MAVWPSKASSAPALPSDVLLPVASLGPSAPTRGRACFQDEPDLSLACVCWVPACPFLSSLDALSLPHAFSYAVCACACGCACLCVYAHTRVCSNMKPWAFALFPVFRRDCVGVSGVLQDSQGPRGGQVRACACVSSTDSSVLVKGPWR